MRMSMKIIRLTTFLDFGGVEKRIEISAKELVQRNDIDLIVISIAKGGTVARHLQTCGIQTIVLCQNHKIPSIKTILALYRLYKKLQPDVVHASGSEANFHGLIAAFFAGIKIRIGEEIGFPNHNLLWKAIFNCVYCFSTKVICISNAVKEKLLEYKEVKESKIKVIYNPAQVSCRKTEYSIQNNTFTFITTCRLFPIKNLENLILVFAEICNTTTKPLRLQIVGDGPEKEKLIHLCKVKNIEKNIEFLGFKEDVSNHLQDADTFILPSYSEGFSLSLVEAMQVGLPCIATRIGGPLEIISNEETGFLIDPYDNNSIKEAMLKVLEMSDTDRRRMGEKAMNDTLARFSVERYVDCLLQIYKNEE